MRLAVHPSVNEDLRELAAIESLKKLDNAFINSALSYAVYTKNASWFESWAKARQDNPKAYMPAEEFVKKSENFNEHRLYDRAFAALIANKMTPVTLDLPQTGKHVSPNYLYEFNSRYENGVYKAMDNLAAATALTSRNADGTKTLHVSFRGTDTQAAPFMKYLLKAYPDMGAYYDSCKPFEEAVLAYAADPKNRISKIEVSGHSLGGAMVQHFFRSPEVKATSVPIQGFTYGSPPAVNKSVYALFPALRHVLARGNVKNLYGTLKSIATLDTIVKDPRIIQYQHAGDIVPKVGNVLMHKTGGEIVTLKDRASSEDYMEFMLTGSKGEKAAAIPNHLGKRLKCKSFLEMCERTSDIMFKKPASFLLKMSQTVYHDMARYTVNLEADFIKVRAANHDVLNKHNIIPRLICPNLSSFGTTCRAMNLQHQSSVRMMGEHSDFNSHMDTQGTMANMGKMDMNKLLAIRKKLISDKAVQEARPLGRNALH